MNYYYYYYYYYYNLNFYTSESRFFTGLGFLPRYFFYIDFRTIFFCFARFFFVFLFVPYLCFLGIFVLALE